MGVSLLLQYLPIAVLVVVSAWLVLRSQFPLAARKLRTGLALALLREGRPGWMKRLGRKVAPATKGEGGCGGCDGCD